MFVIMLIVFLHCVYSHNRTGSLQNRFQEPTKILVILKLLLKVDKIFNFSIDLENIYRVDGSMKYFKTLHTNVRPVTVAKVSSFASYSITYTKLCIIIISILIKTALLMPH